MLFSKSFFKLKSTILTQIFLTFCLIYPTDSNSHGPSRQKIKEKILIDAELSKVWNLVSDFSKFNWNEDILKVSVEGNGVGSVRTLLFNNDKQIQQSLEKLIDEKKIISWRIKKTEQTIMPVNSYQATLILKDLNGKTEVTYKAGFYRGFMGNDPPEELNDVNSKKKAKEFVLKSLSGLKKIAEK